MTLPNRTYSSPAYRYGFQGQEKDDELKGEGNSLNYTFRMHDPRVGRFFAVDPLSKQYPWNSPYQFSGNSTIMSVELEGLEESKTANKNQNSDEEPGLMVKVIAGYINIFDSWSRIKGVNKKEGKSFEDKVINSLEGFKEFATNDTFLFLGALNQPGFKIDFDESGTDEAINFSTKVNFTFKGARLFLKDLNKFKIFNTSSSVNFKSIFSGKYNLKKIFPLTVDGWQNAFGGGKAWGRVDGKQVAFYSMTQKGLQMEINLPQNMQGMGYGDEFFAIAVRESEATMFTATWVKSQVYSTGQSVNLTRYQSALKNGLSAEQAAFKTWSGQQAAKHGFKNVSIKEIENGIEATFTK